MKRQHGRSAMKAFAWCFQITLLMSLFGSNAAFSADQAAPTPPNGAADPYLQCSTELSTDPQFASLSQKLPLHDINTVTFAMLADESYPNPDERKKILEWFSRHDKCWTDGVPLHQAQWPPDIFQLSQEGNAGLHDIGIDLYKGKITFGEANKRLQDFGNSMRARLIPLIKQYQSEIAAQRVAAEQQAQQRHQAENQLEVDRQAAANAEEAQEQSLRQQRAQMFLNYMRAVQPHPYQPPMLTVKPAYSTNCSTVGNSTNCVTQ